MKNNIRYADQFSTICVLSVCLCAQICFTKQSREYKSKYLCLTLCHLIYPKVSDFLLNPHQTLDCTPQIHGAIKSRAQHITNIFCILKMKIQIKKST